MFDNHFWEKYFKSVIDKGEFGKTRREYISAIHEQYKKSEEKFDEKLFNKATIQILDEIIIRACIDAMQLICVTIISKRFAIEERAKETSWYVS